MSTVCPQSTAVCMTPAVFPFEGKTAHPPTKKACVPEPVPPTHTPSSSRHLLTFLSLLFWVFCSDGIIDREPLGIRFSPRSVFSVCPGCGMEQPCVITCVAAQLLHVGGLEGPGVALAFWLLWVALP